MEKPTSAKLYFVLLILTVSCWGIGDAGVLVRDGTLSGSVVSSGSSDVTGTVLGVSGEGTGGTALTLETGSNAGISAYTYGQNYGQWETAGEGNSANSNGWVSVAGNGEEVVATGVVADNSAADSVGYLETKRKRRDVSMYGDGEAVADSYISGVASATGVLGAAVQLSVDSQSGVYGSQYVYDPVSDTYVYQSANGYAGSYGSGAVSGDVANIDIVQSNNVYGEEQADVNESGSGSRPA